MTSEELEERPWSEIVWPWDLRYALGDLDNYLEGYSFQLWVLIYLVLPIKYVWFDQEVW